MPHQTCNVNWRECGVRSEYFFGLFSIHIVIVLTKITLKANVISTQEAVPSKNVTARERNELFKSCAVFGREKGLPADITFLAVRFEVVKIDWIKNTFSSQSILTIPAWSTLTEAK